MSIISAGCRTAEEIIFDAENIYHQGNPRRAVALIREWFHAAPEEQTQLFTRCAITLDHSLVTGVPQLRALYGHAARTAEAATSDAERLSQLVPTAAEAAAATALRATAARDIVVAAATVAVRAERATEHPDAADRIVPDPAARELLWSDETQPSGSGYSTHATPRAQRAPRWSGAIDRAPRNDYREIDPDQCRPPRTAKQLRAERDWLTYQRDRAGVPAPDYPSDHATTAEPAAPQNTAAHPCVECGRTRPEQPEGTDTGLCSYCEEPDDNPTTGRHTWTPTRNTPPSALARHAEQQARDRARRYRAARKRAEAAKGAAQWCDHDGHGVYRCTLTGRHTIREAIQAWCRATVTRHDPDQAHSIIRSMWSAATPTERDYIGEWVKLSPRSPFRHTRRTPGQRLTQPSNQPAPLVAA